jgi:Xaa-Pro aminopeptidase
MISDTQIPLAELEGRMSRFRLGMDKANPGWRLAAIFGRVNQYYFAGTMQDGVLLIPRDAPAVLWVRRSYDRAVAESAFPDIRPMKSFRDAAAGFPIRAQQLFLETEILPLALLQRFQKHFPCREVLSLDAVVARLQAVKSPYEIALMEQAGRIHARVLEEELPNMLSEGISEAELGCQLYTALLKAGHQGLVRFGMFGSEIVVGQIAFGENSLYPTNFDGPGGCVGLGAFAPVLGSRDRLLRKGDLVFVDVGCGVAGYQTDKTQTCVFARPLPDAAIAIHQRCLDLERQIASLLKPGAIPSQIYSQVMATLDPQFLEHFMGLGSRRVSFLGHGTGLLVNELPVLAEGFDEPLEEGMTLAVEPKRAVPGVGLVGIENSYLVTPQGGRCLTGHSRGLVPVGWG